MTRRRIALVVLLGLSALATMALAAPDPIERALALITPEDFRAIVYFLSADALEGRGTGTPGGRAAARYVASEFMRAGLEPVAGGYLQPVPLVGVTPDTTALSLSFQTPGDTLSAAYGTEAVVWPGGGHVPALVRGEVVFAGYGVTAPEYDWDDFKGVDVRGKVLLVLANDPPAPPDQPDLFDGLAMTYYGRWRYKVEAAERRGAAGVLIVHTAEGAGYPWSVVRTSWAGEQFFLPRAPGAPPPPALEGWVTYDFADRLLAAAGLRLDELFVAAARRDFRPVRTGITLVSRMPVRVRRLHTANVVGLLPGADARLADQLVVFTAHYDHLGIGPAVDGDSIYNGAYDNASGVALLVELARAFAAVSPRPRRSILFMATGAEEAGLLGSRYYVRHPFFPLSRTVAELNTDGANLWGETDDVIALGAGRSTLGDMVRREARRMKLRVMDDPAPEKGLFFRSDHFSFARAGVPAIEIEHGLDYRGRSPDWGRETLRRYDRLRYHKPSDAYDPRFDFTGAVQQARLNFLVGYDVANAPTPPHWYPGAAVRRDSAAGGDGQGPTGR